MGVKVLFAFYPLFVEYNHGIALLSAICKQNGIDVDLCLLDNGNDFKNKLCSCDRYDYIGFSCVTKSDYEKCVPFIKLAAAFNYPVMVGGVFAKSNREFVLGDYVCRGEAERLPEFILDSNMDIFRYLDVCDDLNSLPLPDYDLFKDHPFDRQISFLECKKLLPYHSSRGCPFQCSFCLTKYQHKHVRIRSKVAEDLGYLKERYNPDVFFINDELLPYYNLKWRESWNSFRHPFVAYIRADISEDELLWAIDRGMIGCAFGIESGDEDYRNKVLGKMLFDDEIHQTVDILKKHDVYYMPFYMSNTPGESFEIKKKTIEMAEKLGGIHCFWEYTPVISEGDFYDGT